MEVWPEGTEQKLEGRWSWAVWLGTWTDARAATCIGGDPASTGDHNPKLSAGGPDGIPCSIGAFQCSSFSWHRNSRQAGSQNPIFGCISISSGKESGGTGTDIKLLSITPVRVNLTFNHEVPKTFQ